MPLESWDEGAGYEQYVGRWSRLAAAAFVRWLGVPPGLRWLDVGCGTGALSEAILDIAAPGELMGVDQSDHYLAFARQRLPAPGVRFERADAATLPVDAAQFGVAVSGLMLNFAESPAEVVAEMMRAVRPHGTVAAYVWDYAGAMQLMRFFWDAATALDPEAEPLDEGTRFRLCAPEPLYDLFSASGLASVEVAYVDLETPFRDFDDFWSPFLTAQGPAPSYVAALSDSAKERLRDRVREMLPMDADGSIRLTARAWTVRGAVPARA